MLNFRQEFMGGAEKEPSVECAKEIITKVINDCQTEEMEQRLRNNQDINI